MIFIMGIPMISVSNAATGPRLANSDAHS